MKKLLIAAAVVVFGTTAQAADMAPVYRKAAPVAVPFTWTGSYIGGYVGGASSAGQNAMTTDPAVVPNNFGRGNYNGVLPVSYGLGTSVIGGITSGYNWQIAPNWVIGYEGETGYLRLRGSSTMNPPPFGNSDTTAFTNVEEWYSAYTARLGFAWDRSLIYVKGGGILARIETGVVDRGGTVTIDTTSRKWRVGYAFGGGWEYAFDNKWSLKAEYLYLGIENDFQTSGIVSPLNVRDFSTTRIPGIHTGKVGLNYRFDWLSLVR